MFPPLSESLAVLLSSDGSGFIAPEGREGGSIMEERLDEVKKWARDLRREEPRPAMETLGGFKGAARCLDKCRASLLRWEGDYRYGCPMDQEFFTESGIDQVEFKEFVAVGASDSAVDKWIRLHSHAGMRRL
jgi:Domain of unknown function (DUF5069)